MIAPEPFHTVYIDHVQVGESDKKNRYVLTKYCGTTGWLEAAPVKDTSATITAKKLFRHIICRYGAPAVIRCDRGPAFDSESFRHMADLSGIFVH